MPLDPDAALSALRQIMQSFASFVAAHGEVNEADTRANLIDKVLTQVCSWPEADVTREVHSEQGYIDYSLSLRSRPVIAVEAKKEGAAFTLPLTSSKMLKLSGSLLTSKPVSNAIKQVRQYCDDCGIRYAIATNGYAWIVFRAIREDMPWRDGSARVFPSLEYIEENFTDFWNLLSYDAIQGGALDTEFGTSLRAARELHRVIDRLYNADLPLQRNRLHAQLHPLIQTIFQDIADQDPLEILQSCYVHTKSLLIVARDLNAVITDSVPQFLMDQGAEAIIQTATDAGQFGEALSRSIASSSGELYLLLGGIGSGKTTFIKRYEREVGRPLLEGRAVWFHLDFLEAPIDPTTVESFAWQQMLEQLRTRYRDMNFETRRNIKKAFRDKIDVLSQTLRAYTMAAGGFDATVSTYLDKWQSEVLDYGPRLFRVLQDDRKVRAIIFIDNVDQLSPAYQAQVFLLAQRITRYIGSVSILALREESYYTANLQRTLTAYTSRKFHIASPHFRKMIDNRIKYALDILEQSKGPVDYVLRSGIAIDRIAIADFLRIIETSIFERNRNIARFIEALCFGNMRQGLDMFTMFMTSGATDVDKMLSIYRRDGAYYVAFHEFVKSIMLGDRRYYKDQASPILNLFDCGAERNSSHFTGLRILRALAVRRGETSREGQGYVDISQLLTKSEDVFDNREDFIRTINRLLGRQLIEANTRSTDSITGASHVRLTSAGWYYTRYLIKSFSYADLVLQDTPFNDVRAEESIRSLVEQVDNLADSEAQKLTRTQVRFTRVRAFLSYLENEEQSEIAKYDLERRGDVWTEPFMPSIRSQIEAEIAWIQRRIRENRERIEDEPVFYTEEADEMLVENDDDSDAHELIS